MKEILNTMLSALTRGEGVMLCSILKADGSSPRGAGAHMAVFSDGTALGTVGGGAVERQSILLARELLEGKRNALRDFALHPEAANSTGMVCGGDVTVWFQYTPPENAAQIGVLRAWRDALGSGRNVWLCLVLDGETLREFRLLTADELRHGTEWLLYFPTLLGRQHLCRAHRPRGARLPLRRGPCRPRPRPGAALYRL